MFFLSKAFHNFTKKMHPTSTAAKRKKSTKINTTTTPKIPPKKHFIHWIHRWKIRTDDWKPNFNPVVTDHQRSCPTCDRRKRSEAHFLCVVPQCVSWIGFFERNDGEAPKGWLVGGFVVQGGGRWVRRWNHLSKLPILLIDGPGHL